MLWIPGCAENPPDSPHLPQVREALEALRERPEGFVIVEHAETEQFVQYATTAGRGLLFDVPAQALDEGEFEAALDFFGERGLGEPQRYAAIDPHTGRAVEEQISFQTEFKEAEAAARLGLDFFAAVFGHTGAFPLRVTEE